jgi:hypothetical protein
MRRREATVIKTVEAVIDEHGRVSLVVAVVLIVAAILLLSTILVYPLVVARPIPYTVVEEGYALQVPEDWPLQGSEPMLIVLAAPQDMALPSDLSLPEPVTEELERIDRGQSFVVLVHRGGQLPNSGLVKSILRRGNIVIIETLDVDMGPGNYVVPGWTQPYAVVAVEKVDGKWARDIHFILERQTQGPAYETHYYIP